MRLQRVFGEVLFVAIFLWLHFFIRSVVARAEHICNTGGPFGIIVPAWLLLALGAGISAWCIVLWYKEPSCLGRWAWVFLISGGFANLLERQRFGCIMDYIALPFFPAFNVADTILVIGVLVILWRYGSGNRKHS